MTFGIREAVSNKSGLRYLKNSAWMLTEYALTVISGIFVGIYVARYLGPEQFGMLSYALAIVSIFMPLGRLGMESVLVRDISKYPLQRQAYMATAFGIMWVAALIILTMLGGLVYFFESDSNIQVYIWVIASGILFQTFMVVDYNFQAQVKAKYSSIAKSIALCFSGVLKIYLVWIQADLLKFAVAYTLDFMFVAFMLVAMHLHKKQINFLKGFDKKLVKPLLISAWPMILAAMAGMLYMRVDQVMIKNMLDVEQLGLYTAATRIYEGWITIPVVLSLSLLPAIVNLRYKSVIDYEAGMSKLTAMLFWICVFFAVFMTFFSELFISLTFGADFISSENVLIILVWAAMFNAIGSVSVRYLTVEGMEKKIAIRTFVGLVINIILNSILIPVFGIEGAACSTLITIMFVNYFMNYLDRDLKQLRRICNNAMLLRVGVIQ